MDQNVETFSNEKGVYRYSAEDRIEQGLFPHEMAAVNGYIEEEASVLDVGCGGGRTTKQLVKQGYDVTAIDISEEQLVAAKTHFPTYQFITADATSLPFENASFDAILFSNNGIDYISPERRRIRTLAEIRRVLVNEGVFVFSSHNYPTLPTNPLNPIGYINYLKLYVRNYDSLALSGGYLDVHNEYGILKTYHITPGAQKEQLIDAGFHVEDIIGRNQFSPYLDPWPYYVGIKEA